MTHGLARPPSAVLKLGGSLADHAALRPLCNQIGELAAQYKLLVVPGGGPFADTVRHYYASRHLSETTAHKMAILAMDQYGYLLCELLSGAVPVTTLAEIEPIWQIGQLPVLIPSQLLFKHDPLPHSWAVTSDSIAAWVAMQVHASLLILLKDVDGLYRANPKGTESGQLLTQVTLDELKGCGGVDEYFPIILQAAELATWVISGVHPERVRELVTRGTTKGTQIRWA